jgi:hypothetical protein
LSIDQSASWTRDLQDTGDPLLSLFPGELDDPGIVVAPWPDQDNLRNSLTPCYAWSREGTPEGADIRVRRTAHTECLVLESVARWVEPGVVSSSVPLRATFEHSTEIDVTDTFTLGIWGKAAAGVEKRTGTGRTCCCPRSASRSASRESCGSDRLPGAASRSSGTRRRPPTYDFREQGVFLPPEGNHGSIAFHTRGCIRPGDGQLCPA